MRICSLALVLLALPACYVEGALAPATPPLTEIDRAAADRALDDFHDAAAHADEARYFAHFAPNGVFLGTDETERWDVPAFRAYAHPRFASGKAWSFKSVERHIDFDASGRVAWFDERLATERLGAARGSGVLVRDADRNGGWKIAQYNLSIPIPNDRFADVRRVIDEAR